MRACRPGSIQAYLAYIFITLILLLAVRGARMIGQIALGIVCRRRCCCCLSPLITGFSKTLKARLQTRRGPALWQPYRDLSKLLRKGMVIPDTPLDFLGHALRALRRRRCWPD